MKYYLSGLALHASANPLIFLLIANHIKKYVVRKKLLMSRERRDKKLKMAQIEAFYAVINAGSISQAARLSHISQPAVSMQIRELEEYCQLPLLIRTNKGVTPTAAGLVVYQYCQKIISLKKDLANELANLKKQLDKFPELIT